MAKEKTPEELAALAGAIGKDEGNGTPTGNETSADAGGASDTGASGEQSAAATGAAAPQEASGDIDGSSGADAGSDDGEAAGRDSGSDDGEAAGRDSGSAGGKAVGRKGLVSEEEANAGSGGTAGDQRHDQGSSPDFASSGELGKPNTAGNADADELAAQMSYSEFAALEPEAMPMIAAAGAYQALIAVGQAVAAKLAGFELTCGPHPASTLMAREMAGFVRKIGRRATADVLAQHLKIRKLRDSAEISTPERIALTAYIQTLLDLDAFIAAEREAQAKAQEERQTPAPTPIEDTIFEPADDFFTPTY
ncbi:hypothetical protein GOZ78_03555 [Agrobacterium vitis]|uniref:hypothetical protein n=1 Tax=Agrobacterium vitis TaxID=373 RepID=UPI0012E859F9|nr:hypothetical protein [Agrobacterium vitis]MVA09095.1 hypothetical protein [Agrobacterium vitis]